MTTNTAEAMRAMPASFQETALESAMSAISDCQSRIEKLNAELAECYMALTDRVVALSSLPDEAARLRLAERSLALFPRLNSLASARMRWPTRHGGKACFAISRPVPHDAQRPG
jgi:hypothetical protein